MPDAKRLVASNIHSRGDSIINVVQKLTQVCFVIRRNKPKFQKKFKTDRRIFFQLDRDRIHEIYFAQKLFPKYHWHQTVTGEIPPPVRTNITMFYLIFLHTNKQILLYVTVYESTNQKRLLEVEGLFSRYYS